MFWSVISLVSLVLVILIISYNRLVRDKHRTTSGWSDIEVQLKRRHDLIPKLVEAAKQYAHYEQAAQERISALRHAAEAVTSNSDQADAESRLSGALIQVFALSEAYPELKANQSFLHLQQEISSVEQDIQFARRYYNGAVNHFNTRIDSFPDLIVAQLLRFTPSKYFDFKGSKK
jgi:LemA protein